jgi:hypothetical protein
VRHRYLIVVESPGCVGVAKDVVEDADGVKAWRDAQCKAKALAMHASDAVAIYELAGHYERADPCWVPDRSDRPWLLESGVRIDQRTPVDPDGRP